MDKEPQAQPIAEAIAAFAVNNSHREPPRAQETLKAITMVGTSPIFYKIPVNQALVDAIATSQYPPQPTIVQRFVPPVSNPNRYKSEGMRPLDNRRIVLQCFEAMRAL